MRAQLHGPHRLHQAAQFEDLFLEQFLYVGQLVGKARGNGHFFRLAAQDVHLHFHADERLDGAVVQFAGNAGALDGPGSRPQAPQKVHGIDSRSDVFQESLGEAQFLAAVAAHGTVIDDDPSGPLLSHVK